MPATRALIAASDVVLALGTEPGPTDCDFYEDGGLVINGALLRVDIDPVQIMRGKVPTLALVGDAAQTALALTAMISPRPPGDGVTRAASAAAGTLDLPPAMQGDLHLLAILRDTLQGANFMGDSTQLAYAGNIGFAAPGPASRFGSVTGFGTLGYRLPAAIGAQGRPVVALVGDGGLQFSLAELASATGARVPLILMLHDNHSYGEIKSAMLAAGIPPLGVDILTPDLAAIASACGWLVLNVARLAGLPNALRLSRQHGGPVMILVTDALRDEAAAPFG